MKGQTAILRRRARPAPVSRASPRDDGGQRDQAEMDEIDAQSGIGIRIEDDILMTKNGPQRLTEGVPKAVDAIEALLA